MVFVRRKLTPRAISRTNAREIEILSQSMISRIPKQTLNYCVKEITTTIEQIVSNKEIREQALCDIIELVVNKFTPEFIEILKTVVSNLSSHQPGNNAVSGYISIPSERSEVLILEIFDSIKDIIPAGERLFFLQTVLQTYRTILMDSSDAPPKFFEFLRLYMNFLMEFKNEENMFMKIFQPLFCFFTADRIDFSSTVFINIFSIVSYSMSSEDDEKFIIIATKYICFIIQSIVDRLVNHPEKQKIIKGSINIIIVLYQQSTNPSTAQQMTLSMKELMTILIRKFMNEDTESFFSDLWHDIPSTLLTPNDVTQTIAIPPQEQQVNSFPSVV